MSRSGTYIVGELIAKGKRARLGLPNRFNNVLAIAEFSGVAALDVSASISAQTGGSGTSTKSVGPTSATSKANELVLAWFGDGSAGGVNSSAAGAGRTRSVIQSYLDRTARRPLKAALRKRLEEELPKWRGSFSKELDAFEKWLRNELTQELTVISAAHSKAFCEPLREVERQCQNNLQGLRDRLSEKVMQVFGVPLRTTEVEIEVQEPRLPDISPGKIFDRSWEVISLLIPMPLVRWAVHRRFFERAEQAAYVNLSRLTAQWEERVHAAIYKTEREAERRLDELVTTVSRLLSGEERDRNTPISGYLARIQEVLKQVD